MSGAGDPGSTGQQLRAQPELADPPLETQLDRFWELGEDVEDLQFSIEAPRVAGAILKRLGNPFGPEGDEASRAELAQLYRVISERAIRMALDE